MKKQTKTTPSVVLTSSAFAPLRRDKPATIVPGGFTLGLDPGDRSHHVCVLDAAGQIVREGALPNTRPALAKLQPRTRMLSWFVRRQAGRWINHARAWKAKMSPVDGAKHDVQHNQRPVLLFE
jgi:hypothetical protein